MVNAASVAVENARLHEELVSRGRLEQQLQDAREVQKRFLPTVLPQVEDYTFFDYYESAETVGGDYYAYVELPDDRIAIAVGDVSGKGMPAALLVARLSSDVRTSLLHHEDPADALHAINLALQDSHIEDRFVTMVLMVVQPGRNELTIASAGHPPPLLRRADGSIEEIRVHKNGLPLNVSTEAKFRPESMALPLAPGDAVIAFSDGVTEARDPSGELYGDARLRRAIEFAPGDAQSLGEAVLASLWEFAAGEPNRDDVTLVCFARS